MVLYKVGMKFSLLIFCLLAFSIQAKEKIVIGFGDALEPWVNPATNDGILIDIITEALAPNSYELKFFYYPYLRRITAFRGNDVDVVSDMNLKTLEGEKLVGHFTGEVYAYENYAFSLRENNYDFKHLNELANYSLMSWQGAIMHLGGEYAEMASKNSQYRESHDQLRQLQMLFHKRVQVIQLDEKIFNYYRLQMINDKKEIALMKVDKFPLFSRSPNGFLFKDEKVRDVFLRELALMKEDGRFDNIFLKYAPSTD
jgi:polar amino acid transport system substrate-binding protein